MVAFITIISAIISVINTCLVVLDLADIGSYGVFLATALVKFQHTRNFGMSTANIQDKLIVNENPHIIITREVKTNWNFIIKVVLNCSGTG